jgi:hypothetical protein
MVATAWGSSLKRLSHFKKYAMNRLPFDANLAPLGSQWMATAPSQFLDEPAARLAPTHPQRKLQKADALTAEAHVWLERLPPRYQPLETARRHPHVVNRLSTMWATPTELPAFFCELMLSSRPGREGFAFEVLTELADLQSMMELMLEKGRRR